MFAPLSRATTLEKLDDEKNERCEGEEEDSHDVDEEVLDPVEVVGVRPHAGVVRMSEEILQPPGCPGMSWV